MSNKLHIFQRTLKQSDVNILHVPYDVDGVIAKYVPAAAAAAAVTRTYETRCNAADNGLVGAYRLSDALPSRWAGAPAYSSPETPFQKIHR